MQLFSLRHNDYEWQVCYRGPDLNQIEFKALCDSLLPDAAKRCLDKQRELEEPYSIYWDDILEELDLMLRDRGFERLKFAEVEYFGWVVGKPSNELLGEDVVKSIEQFNQEREQEFQSQFRDCQFTS